MLRKLLKVAAILSLVLSTAPAWAQTKPIDLTWAAGVIGGGWYDMAPGFADLIHGAEPGISLKVIPGGGVANPALIGKRECDLGWGIPFMLVAAFNGEDPFKEKYANLRALVGGMSLLYLHFVVGAESNIRSIDEIFGQKKPIRIAVPPVETSDEWVFRKVLQHYRTDYQELQRAGFTFFHEDYAAQVNLFKDRKVDAVFTFLAIPAASVSEASAARKLRLLQFPADLILSLNKYGIYGGKIPEDTYPKAVDGDMDVVTLSAATVIATNAEMPEDLAYRITRVINENLDKLRTIHESLRPYTLEEGPTATGISLHPGAARYYREKGVLKH